MSMQNSFSFKDGKFVSVDDPLPDGSDVADELKKMGYRHAQSFGDTNGFSFDVYQNTDEGWYVYFDTGSISCSIFVDDWPSLIGLLSLLSPIVLAGMTNQQEGEVLAHFRVQPADTRKQRR